MSTKTSRAVILCLAAIALGALTDPTAAQRVNSQSNTERGGADGYWSSVTGGVSTMSTATGRANDLAIGQGTVTPAAHSNLFRASVDNVAAWVATDLGGVRPVIEIDPRIRSSGRGLPAAGSPQHAPEVLAGAADEKVVVMTAKRAEECAGAGMRSCRTGGLFVGVAFDAPAVTGDAATVTVFVRVSREPNEDDKARARRANNPEAALRRLGTEAGSATLMQLSLERRNGAWAVVKRTIIGQS